MNGLPRSIDLTGLIGAHLIQLCFGENEFQIHLDSDAKIVVESRVTMRSGPSGETRIDDYAQAASVICSLLGTQIQFATRTDDGGLLLRFDSGTELRVLNSNTEYESFQVHLGGHIYVA